jgi:transcriptional regulator with XRE-family HTH domain
MYQQVHLERKRGMSYHYGQTIREYRMSRRMTLEQLAAKWPSKETGVNTRYVIDIEAGRKHITDIETLRKLASLLNIPLWKFGLSEYDPFSANEVNIENFDVEALIELIQDAWYIRLYAPLEVTEQRIQKTCKLFHDLIDRDGRCLKSRDFMILYAQVKRLEEVIYTEKRQYDLSLQCSRDMLDIAKASGDMKTEALSLTRIGIELLRNEDIKALEYLEGGRDLAFITGSKELGAYCYSMLARGYATFGDEKRFVQAVNTSIALGETIQGQAIVTKDHVYHAYSALLEEQINGLILFGRGMEAVNGLPEIEKQVKQENNIYLEMWLPLDYAQAYLAMGEIEQSIQSLESFTKSIKNYHSKRLNSRIKSHLDKLDATGYSDVPCVKRFKRDFPF